ncbi:hypothetical protein GCM10010193_65640 [Kitasatospora atroaurantiaca]|uniref:Uncharacterized protein n=1 Tax=Kitasatospora atroaurantiaca TaxID=285545 RepID=A0A561ESI4_9ACTN|nr:hypothetical protein [Kitasatospora atroaurantiaca]TWE18572.1 hypothetical protein FB465_3652 [Kitasatospora atroaurantiaca]
MAQTIRRFPQLTLNTDGRPHPKENTLVGLTVVFGLLSFVSSFFYNLHIMSSWTGLAGVVTGLWGQFISVTTAERFVLVIALVASAFGLGIGMAHGGFFGGVW